jgi:hypothetical protein
MIKLVCTVCHQTWYTANTVSFGDCDYCHGELIQVDVNQSVHKYSSNIDVHNEVASACE